jgi:TatD DNase family protein
MVFVDVHCHLDWESYGEDIYKILDEMKEKRIIGLSNTTTRRGFELAKEKFKDYENVKVCPGLYPTEANKISDKDFEDYLNYIESIKDEFIAIGEIGLDKHLNKGMSEEDQEIDNKSQEDRFRKLIELGIKLDKPLIIHTRKAEARVLEIVREYVESTKFKKFNLHCFMGKKKLIKDIKELQIYCSIPYIIRNTQSFQILVKELPIRQILVETDSPFLHPDKIQNSPLSVPFIYEEIAKIKGYDKIEIENIIFNNYMKLTN